MSRVTDAKATVEFYEARVSSLEEDLSDDAEDDLYYAREALKQALYDDIQGADK